MSEGQVSGRVIFLPKGNELFSFLTKNSMEPQCEQHCLHPLGMAVIQKSGTKTSGYCAGVVLSESTPDYLTGCPCCHSSCHTRAPALVPSLAPALAGSWRSSHHRSPLHRPGSDALCRYLWKACCTSYNSNQNSTERTVNFIFLKWKTESRSPGRQVSDWNCEKFSYTQDLGAISPTTLPQESDSERLLYSGEGNNCYDPFIHNHK